MNKKLLYITSGGIGENIWGVPTIKFLTEHYDVKILCDIGKKNYNFLNTIFKAEDFIFYGSLALLPHSVIENNTLSVWQNKRLKELVPWINSLDFDVFVFNQWQENKKLKNVITIDNIIDHVQHKKIYTFKDPRHETLFELCGGDLNKFDSYYEKIKLPSVEKNKSIIICQGSLKILRAISREFIEELVKRLSKEFSDYNLFVLQNENLNLHDGKTKYMDSRNFEIIRNLMSSGAALLISPDSGVRWFSQLYGIKNILISELPGHEKEYSTFKSLLNITELTGKNVDQIVKAAKKLLIHD
jgi:hypothetical protein